MTHRATRRPDEIIVSSANPTIKFVRSLQRRKARHMERAFVVEGFRAVSDALGANAHLRTLLVRDDVPERDIDSRVPATIVRRVSKDVMASISNVELPQGILAVVETPEPIDIGQAVSGATLILIADGIRDPGNLGTLLRSSAGAGVDVVAISDDTVDPFNPKVVRAGMGAHFRLPIVQATPERLSDALEAMDQVIVAEADGATLYDDVDLTRPTAIVIGGEAFGPLGHLHHPRLQTVRIPLHAGVESLNAGVAGSLLVFEAARQRRRRDHQP